MKSYQLYERLREQISQLDVIVCSEPLDMNDIQKALRCIRTSLDLIAQDRRR